MVIIVPDLEYQCVSTSSLMQNFCAVGTCSVFSLQFLGFSHAYRLVFLSIFLPAVIAVCCLGRDASGSKLGYPL
jgi:hypothetical protein